MKFLLKLLLLAALALALPILPLRAADRLPNIVILYADDMGVGDVSRGDSEAKIQTPNLDRLAAQGMTFTDGHSSSGICTPSRFALLTGQHHWRRFHGIVGAFGGTVFEPDNFTIAKMFRQQGYRTGCFGKWHLGWNFDAIRNPGVKKADLTKAASYDWSKRFPDGPLDQGFDHYFGDGTINFPPYCWIEGDRFLTIPDRPVIKSQPLAGGGTFRPGPMAESWNPYDILPTITEKTVEWIGEQDAGTPFFAYLAFNSPHYPIVPNEEFHGKSQAGYYGDFVIETDAMVGKVLAALEKGGFADDTLVIFTADKRSRNRSLRPPRRVRPVEFPASSAASNATSTKAATASPSSSAGRAASKRAPSATRSSAKSIWQRPSPPSSIILSPKTKPSTATTCLPRAARRRLRPTAAHRDRAKYFAGKIRPAPGRLGVHRCSDGRGEKGRRELPAALRPFRVRKGRAGLVVQPQGRPQAVEKSLRPAP